MIKTMKDGIRRLERLGCARREAFEFYLEIEAVIGCEDCDGDDIPPVVVVRRALQEHKMRSRAEFS